MTPRLKTKRAGETRLGQFNFADRLTSASYPNGIGGPSAVDADEITTATVVEVGSSDLTIVVTEADETFVTFTVAGGTAGREYILQCEAVTSEGQTLIGRKTLNVI